MGALLTLLCYRERKVVIHHWLFVKPMVPHCIVRRRLKVFWNDHVKSLQTSQSSKLRAALAGC